MVDWKRAIMRDKDPVSSKGKPENSWYTDSSLDKWSSHHDNLDFWEKTKGIPYTKKQWMDHEKEWTIKISMVSQLTSHFCNLVSLL